MMIEKKMRRFKIRILAVVMFLFSFLLFAGMANILSAEGKPAQSGKIVVINPAQGGKDNGISVDGKVFEKDIVLGLALSLKDKAPNCGFAVSLTRDKDADLTLSDRITMANMRSPMAFISFHVGASFDSAVRGIKIYTWSKNLGMLSLGTEKKFKSWTDNTPGSQDAGGGEASNETPSAAPGTAPKLKIKPLSEVQEGSSEESQKLASAIKDEISKLPDIPCTLEHAPLADLGGIAAPAVVIEVFQASNPKDKSALLDENIKDSIASAICKGVGNYLSGKKIQNEE